MKLIRNHKLTTSVFIALFLVMTLGIGSVFGTPAGGGTVYYVGDGSDGAKTISTTVTEDTANGLEDITSGASSGQADVVVANGATFTANDWVLIYDEDGTYEFAQILSISSNTLTLRDNLQNIDSLS